MGQKVNPHGMRVGVIKDWDSRWYASNEKVGDLLVEDHKIRVYLKKLLFAAGVSKIEIERSNEVVTIYLHVARPGVVIGKGGEQIEQYRKDVEKLIGKTVKLNIVEVRALNFNNVDNDRLAELLLALCAELLDFCAALTDDHTGLCAVNVNANLGGIALNFNLRNTCEVELLLQRFAEVVVLNERIAEISFLCEPAGIPVFDDAHA